MTDSTDDSLTGRVAAVTGASSGIGQAIAEALGAAGAEVFMCGRSAGPMQESQARIEAAGGKAAWTTFDVRDVAALQSWVADSAADAGQLNIMVNNAGLGHPSTIADGDPEGWREMLEVNVLALLAGCQAAIRAMRHTSSQGHIVNVSSTAALRRDSGVYGATKAAVNLINSTLREELQDEPIRVVSIMPGIFATNFSRNFDRKLVESVAASAGIEDLDFDEANRLPRQTLEALQSRLSPVFGDVVHIANAVKYVAAQPIELEIEELVIRPQKALEL